MPIGSTRARLAGVLFTLLFLASVPILIRIDLTPVSETARNVEAFHREAVRLERAAEFEAAADAWFGVARLEPDRVEAWLRWHGVLRRLGRAHEAHDLFSRLRREDPADPVHAFLRGYALLWQTANWHSHERAFDQVIALDPSSPWPRAFQYHRQSHATGEELERAMEGLDHCLEIAPTSVACLQARGQVLLKVGKVDRAAEYLRRALDVDPDWMDRTTLYLDLVRAQFLAGQPEEAERVAQRAFKEFRERGDRPSLLRLATLHLTAPAWVAEPDPRTEAVLQHLGRVSRSTLDAVCDRATGYLAIECHRVRLNERRAEGLHAEAIHEADRALEILRGRDGPLLVADLLVERCRLATTLGRYEKAAPDCEAAENLYLEHDHFSEALAPLHWRVHLYRDSGEMERALQTARRYLRFARRYGYEGEPVSALDDLAWIAWRTGNLDLTLEAFEEMRSRVDRLGAWSYEVAHLYEAMGDYRGALLYYGRELERPSRKKANRDRLRSLHGLARIHLVLGDTARARSHAMSYFDAYVTDPNIRDLPVPNLAEILLAEGGEAGALRTARTVLRLARTSGSSQAVARARADLARIHLAGGRHRDAERELVDLLEEYDRLGLYWERGDALLALAMARSGAGDIEGAFAALAEANSHVAVTRDPETRWRIQQLQGRLFESRGEAAPALAAYERAIGILEKTRLTIPSGDLRSWYMTGRLDPYEDAIRLRLGVSGMKPDPMAALALSERKKARALRDRGRGRSSGEIDGYERRMAMLLPALAKELDRPDTRDERVHRLGASIDSLAALRPALAEADRPGVEAVRRALAPRQALVEYTFVRDTLWAFVVRPHGVTARRLAISRDVLSERIRSLHAPLEALTEGRITIAQAEWPLNPARDLHRALVQPLEDDLAGVGTLLLVPEGELWLVPFDALVTRIPSGIQQRNDRVLFERYERVEYLIDRYATALLPSAEWLLLPSSSSRPMANGEMLILGTPGGSESAARADRAHLPIPAAREEVRRIRKLWPGARTLLSGAATETRFREEAPLFRYVHVAAHAVADPASPSSSGIALAADDIEDGFLSALEISRMSMSTDLVALSGCRTASGPIRAGEGVMALSRAFLQAGVPSVLATQWSIPDVSGGIMPGFYESLLESGDPVTSLRRAKVEFRSRREREGDRLVSRAHPIYWAPFVLVGRPSVGLPVGATSAVAHTSVGFGVSSP